MLLMPWELSQTRYGDLISFKAIANEIFYALNAAPLALQGKGDFSETSFQKSLEKPAYHQGCDSLGVALEVVRRVVVLGLVSKASILNNNSFTRLLT